MDRSLFFFVPSDSSGSDRRLNSPRDGWSAAFQEMARRGDDAMLDASAPIQSNWDENEWEW